jgi:hypothetical protein
MLAKQSILKSVIIFFILIWFTDVDAAIYKWRDENGITHFTDNLTKVPKAFREKPFIKDLLPRKIKSKPKEKNTQNKPIEAIKREEPAEKKIKEGLTEAQRLAIEKAINFLKTDIPRYENFFKYPPSRSKFRVLRQAMAGANVEKQGLIEQIRYHDIPIIKEITEYLDGSIAAGEKSQRVLPTIITYNRQTFILENRLKSETEKGKQLLTRLTSALNNKK